MENQSEPFISKRLAGIVSSVAGGILLVVVLAVINAPRVAEEASQRRHDAQERTIARVLERVETLQRSYSAHRTIIDTDVAELKILVENGTGDRFSGTDWERESSRLDEREARTRLDISDLKRHDRALEQRIE